jgi:hypothetical protein
LEIVGLSRIYNLNTSNFNALNQNSLVVEMSKVFSEGGLDGAEVVLDIPRNWWAMCVSPIVQMVDGYWD